MIHNLSPTCPICSEQDAHCFWNCKSVPVLQHLLTDSVAEAKSAPRGDLSLSVCHRCGFVFNHSFRAELASYNGAYNNSQAFSSTFNTHAEHLLERLVAKLERNGGPVLEIGCGQGDFLRKLVQAAPEGVCGIGFDPCYKGPRLQDDGRLKFYCEEFSPWHIKQKPQLVICRHVIEHIPAPLELIQSLREVVDEQTLIVFETPDIEWILKHQVLWDFFYEHCSLFSKSSLRHAFEQNGFIVNAIERRFGEQYLEITAQIANRGIETTRPNCTDTQRIVDLAASFRESAPIKLARNREYLRRLSNAGRLVVWGAGAKGVTFAQLTDAKAHSIECFIDQNPAKQNGFLPSTGHPIVSPENADLASLSSIIVLNPNYTDEIAKTVKAANPVAEIIDLSL